jgi:hypothetical protein
MSLRDMLEKAGIASSLANLALDAIAEKINRELEEKYVDACAKALIEKGRADDLRRQLDAALVELRVAEAERDTATSSAQALRSKVEFLEARFPPT